MKFIYLVMLWFSGILIGVSLTLFLFEDTGSRCMSMYENPEDQIECVWLLNNN
jgi:hypothetical protein